MKKQTAMTDNSFDALCASRFSCRSYSPAEVVDEILKAILEDARLAPSACNRQPWRFVVVKSDAGRETVRASYDRPWFADAPLYILMCGVPADGWVRADDGKNHTDIDVAIATEHVCLAAEAHGLGSCWVCNFKPEVLAGLDLPDGVVPVAIIPLGYPGEGVGAPAKVRRVLEETVLYR